MNELQRETKSPRPEPLARRDVLFKEIYTDRWVEVSLKLKPTIVKHLIRNKQDSKINK